MVILKLNLLEKNSKSVKYLGIEIDKNLNQKHYVNPIVNVGAGGRSWVKTTPSPIFVNNFCCC